MPCCKSKRYFRVGSYRSQEGHGRANPRKITSRSKPAVGFLRSREQIGQSGAQNDELLCSSTQSCPYPTPSNTSTKSFWGSRISIDQNWIIIRILYLVSITKIDLSRKASRSSPCNESVQKPLLLLPT